MNRIWRFAVEHFLAVPVGVVIALAWSNLHPESYFTLSDALAFSVNNVGMALFFAFVTQEIVESMMEGGALHTWRRALLPIAAAVGGTLGAIAVYEGYLHLGDEELLTSGWPIVCAIDGGLCYFLVRVLLGRHRATPFLLFLVIVSDGIGLVAIGLHQPEGAHVAIGATAIALGVAVSLVLRRLKPTTFWPHLLISGTILWWGFNWSGLHPALALVPMVPFLPRAPRDLNLLADEGPHNSPAHLEHALRLPVQVVLFLFALVNAGVLLRGYGSGTFAVLAAALIGRPLGILVAVRLSTLLGLHLPAQVDWRELCVVAFIASIGFAFGLFVATAVFPVGPTLGQLKMGALLTVGGAIVATAAARLLGAGRFKSRAAALGASL